MTRFAVSPKLLCPTLRPRIQNLTLKIYSHNPTWQHRLERRSHNFFLAFDHAGNCPATCYCFSGSSILILKTYVHHYSFIFLYQLSVLIFRLWSCTIRQTHYFIMRRKQNVPDMGEKRNAYETMVRKPEEKRPLEKCRRRREKDVKTYTGREGVG